MATYIIGDLQGCYDELQKLLKRIEYQPNIDELWFAGDLVNRGPKSLECLRFVKNLGAKSKMVLGNHDFHLLAAYSGVEKFLSKSDTLDDILNAPDVDELMDWLRQQPLMVRHDFLPLVMVHAGIPPQWTINEALAFANEVTNSLKQSDWQDQIRNELFGSEPSEWQVTLTGWDRLRYIVNAFARMRYCGVLGKLEFSQKGKPEKNSTEYQPWFTWPNRKNKDHEIFFGHWSTLGAMDAYNIHTTDTGCLWGGKLTAYCLETQKRHTVNCPQTCQPKKPQR